MLSSVGNAREICYFHMNMIGFVYHVVKKLLNESTNSLKFNESEQIFLVD